MEARTRAGVRLTALALAAFQLAGTFGAAHNQPEPGRRALDALAVVLALAGPAALAWRDRHPLVAVAVSVAAADVYLARGYPYGPVFLSVVVALFVAVQAGLRRQTWALVALAFVGFVAADALDPYADTGMTTLGHLALVIGWLVGVLAVADVVRTRRERVADERRRAQGEQRLALAHELHDVLAHHISLINVQASVALHLLDEQPDRARPALTHIKAASRDALHELRAALALLRGDGAGGAPRAPAPTLADHDQLVGTVRASGLVVRLERPDPLPVVAPAVELATYRIVQEALTNVTRHAHARHATVRLAHSGGGIAVEVVDDGTGVDRHGDRDIEPGNGIAGMRERAAALGGTVDAGPRPDGPGFRVRAELPA
jgi:signal transduction histidine kinase